jgi:glycosyltransferase involved in cell wall biosynthesis
MNFHKTSIRYNRNAPIIPPFSDPWKERRGKAVAKENESSTNRHAALGPGEVQSHQKEIESSVLHPHGAPEGPWIPLRDPKVPKWLWERFLQFLEAQGSSAQQWIDLSPQPAKTDPLIPEVSVVLPVHNEAENLPVLYPRLSQVLKEAVPSHEIIFVDDGSTDPSPKQLYEFAGRDPHVTIVELSRNFGHQTAISAGLDYARGRGVIIMDADLQDPPEVLPEFIRKWKEGYDVVYAIRQERKEGLLKRAAYALFYRLWKRIANIPIPLDAGDFCIMDRRVVDLLKAMPERNRFIRGIRSWVGLKQVGLPYERQGRHAGRPSYTMMRLIYLALDGLVSFSYVPLRVITLLGFAVSLLSIVLAAFYVAKKLLLGLSPPGFATLTAAIFFLAGIQLITIGVIGEYVGRIFEEVKRRPLYIVRQVRRGSFHAHPHAQQ